MIFLSIGIFIISVLCIFNVIKSAKKGWLALWAAVLPHSVLLIVYVFQVNINVLENVIFAAVLTFLALSLIIRFNFLPLPKKMSDDRRLNILAGGRTLMLTGMYVTFIQALLYIVIFKYKYIVTFETHWIITDLIINIAFILLLFANGFWRIILLSRRLNIFKKVIYSLLIWFPIVNIFVILAVSHAALTERDHELYKINQNKWRADSQVCRTKYPLIMLHGVGFRDLKYLNYWGRIPKELIKNGAEVYYGNQEAWGTIEDNAEDVKKKILEITKTTGAQKVNIIAHSKGGLDARYMISKLGMEEYTASLTTISTPHRGSFVMDFADKLPDKLVSFIGRQINKYFKVIGDKNPDFEKASKQFLTKNAAKFNEEVDNSSNVYYQSYATVMSRAHSDYILFFPYLIGRFSTRLNDGLVSVDSAKWGEFKGVVKSSKRRGISHGDIIDLRRNDYKGFDVRAFYVKLVAELKDMGM